MPTSAHLLKCPRCSSPLAPGASCRGCGLAPSVDGVMDFVAGSLTTKLDDLDYDAFYDVSPERADRDFATVKRLRGERLSASLGNAIEVGCGTGGFTVGALRGLALENAVLTDISPRMLRRCRRRLREVGVLGKQNTVFATYSGNEDCFAEAAYDCCFGSAVVHHILDVEGFFRSVARWLRPGGRAFFVEPSARCHWALVLTTADVAAILLARDADPDVVARLLNWTAEVRYNLVHAGDLALLERREDKHLFSKEQVAALAGAAGFARSATIPFGVADHGRIALTEYLGQNGFGGRPSPSCWTSPRRSPRRTSTSWTRPTRRRPASSTWRSPSTAAWRRPRPPPRHRRCPSRAP